MSAETDRANYYRALLNQRRTLEATDNALVNPTMTDLGTQVMAETGTTQTVDDIRGASEKTDTSTDSGINKVLSKTMGTIDELAAKFGSGFVKGWEGGLDLIATGLGALGWKEASDWAKQDIGTALSEWTKTYANPSNLIGRAINGQLNWEYFDSMWKGAKDIASSGLFMSTSLGNYREDADKYYLYNDEMNSWTGQMAGGLAQSFGEMLPSIMVGNAVGAAGAGANIVKTVSMGAFGAAAAGNSAEESLNDGDSAGTALAYGIGKGAVEVASEIVVSKALSKIAGKMGAKELADIWNETDINGWNLGKSIFSKSSAKEVIAEMFEEGAEEVFSDMMDPLVKQVTGKEIDYEVFGKEHMEEMGNSFISGALMGGISNATQSFQNSRKQAVVRSKVGDAGYDALVKFYDNMELQGKYNDMKANGSTDAEIESELGVKATDNMREFVKDIDAIKESNPEQYKELIRYMANPNGVSKEWKAEYDNAIETEIRDNLSKDFLEKYVSTEASKYATSVKTFSNDDFKTAEDFESKFNVTLADEQKANWENEKRNSFVIGETLYIDKSNSKMINRLLAHELMSHRIMDESVLRDEVLESLENNKEFMNGYNEWYKSTSDRSSVEKYRNGNTDLAKSERLASMMEYISENKATNMDETLSRATKGRIATTLSRIRTAIATRKSDAGVRQGLRTIDKALKTMGNDARRQISEALKTKASFSVTENGSALSTDSEGKKLSDGQKEFFKDTKIKNWKGELLRVYHGTDAEFFEFSEKKIGTGSGGNFGSGYYFAKDRSLSAHYGNRVIDCYLNITNPFDYYGYSIKELIGMLDKSGYEYNRAKLDEINDKYPDLDVDLIDTILENVLTKDNPYSVFSEMLKKSGYDGVVAEDEIVAFYPSQIKDINNLNPTENEDIRFSSTEMGTESQIDKTAKNDYKVPNKTNLKENYLQWNRDTLFTNKSAKALATEITDRFKEAARNELGDDVRIVIDTKRIQESIFNSNFSERNLDAVLGAILSSKVTFKENGKVSKTTIESLTPLAKEQITTFLKEAINDGQSSSKLTRLNRYWKGIVSEIAMGMREYKRRVTLVRNYEKIRESFKDKVRGDVSWGSDTDRISHTFSLIANPFVRLKYNSSSASYTTRDFVNELDTLIENYKPDIIGKSDLLEYDSQFADIIHELRSSIVSYETSSGTRYKSMDNYSITLVGQALSRIDAMMKRVSGEIVSQKQANARATASQVKELKWANNPLMRIIRFLPSSYAAIGTLLGGTTMGEKFLTDYQIADSNALLYYGNINDIISKKIKKLKIGRLLEKKYKFTSFNQFKNEYKLTGDQLVSMYISLKTAENFNAIAESGLRYKNDRQDKKRDLIGANVGYAEQALNWLESNLSSEMKEYAMFLKETMNGQIKSDYKEWFRETYNVEPNDLDDYWVLYRFHEFESDIESAIKSVGLFDRAKKRHSNVKDSVMLVSATNTVTTYAQQFARQRYVMPVYHDIIDTINARCNNYGDTLSLYLRRNIGETNMDFLMDKLNEMAGLTEKSKTDLLDFIQSGFVLKSLSFNVGSAMKQPLSIFNTNIGNLRIVKGTISNAWARLTNDKTFMKEYRELVDEIGSVKYRKRIVKAGESMTGKGFNAQVIGETGMKMIEATDYATVTNGLAVIMFVGDSQGYKIGTQENKDFVKRYWEGFRMTQVGSNALATNGLARGNAITRMLFGIMQGANRTRLASDIYRIGIWKRNIGVDINKLNSRLETAKAEAESLLKKYSEQMTEINGLESELKNTPKGDDYDSLKAEIDAKRKTAQDTYNEACDREAETRSLKVKIEEYGRFQVMGGAVGIPMNIIAGNVIQGILATLINELMKHIKGKKDWDDWEFGLNFWSEVLLNSFVGHIPVVNSLVNLMVKDYDISVASADMVNDIASVVKTIGKRVINGEELTFKDIMSAIEDGGGMLTGVSAKQFYNYAVGIIGTFDADKAVKYRNVLYSTSSASALSTYRTLQESGTESSQTRQLKYTMETYKTKTSNVVANEINSLYKEGFNAIAKNYMTSYTNDKGEEITLTASQVAEFRKLYDQSDKAIQKLIRTAEYKRATSENKAKMLKKAYDTYYSYAGAKAVGYSDQSRISQMLTLTNGGMDISKYIGYLNEISAITDTKTKTRKELVIQYVNRIRNLSKTEKIALMKMAGYSVTDKTALRGFLVRNGATYKEAKAWLEN